MCIRLNSKKYNTRLKRKSEWNLPPLYSVLPVTMINQRKQKKESSAKLCCLSRILGKVGRIRHPHLGQHLQCLALDLNGNAWSIKDNLAPGLLAPTPLLNLSIMRCSPLSPVADRFLLANSIWECTISSRVSLSENFLFQPPVIFASSPTSQIAVFWNSSPRSNPWSLPELITIS